LNTSFERKRCGEKMLRRHLLAFFMKSDQTQEKSKIFSPLFTVIAIERQICSFHL